MLAACGGGDGFADTADNCPAVANQDQNNTDGDAMGDACDEDDDNDGVLDGADAFPRDPTESLDSDGDGIGNNADMDDDGNGRAIRNVIINASGEGGTGFFGAVTHMAELHNISLSNVNFFRGSRGTILNIGALVGSATGATITANNVMVGTFIGDTLAGGLVGNAQGAIVTSNSVAAGSIISDNGRVGGLVGDGGGAAITFNSVAVASISVAEDSAGGLAGSVVRISSSTAREIGHDERC